MCSILRLSLELDVRKFQKHRAHCKELLSSFLQKFLDSGILQLQLKKWEYVSLLKCVYIRVKKVEVKVHFKERLNSGCELLGGSKQVNELLR